MNTTKIISRLTLIIPLLFLWGCSKEDSKKSLDENYPKTLVVRHNPKTKGVEIATVPAGITNEADFKSAIDDGTLVFKSATEEEKFGDFTEDLGDVADSNIYFVKDHSNSGNDENTDSFDGKTFDGDDLAFLGIGELGSSNLRSNYRRGGYRGGYRRGYGRGYGRGMRGGYRYGYGYGARGAYFRGNRYGYGYGGYYGYGWGNTYRTNSWRWNYYGSTYYPTYYSGGGYRYYYPWYNYGSSGWNYYCWNWRF